MADGMIDAQERTEVSSLLEGLPPDHPARQALSAGADGVKLTHVVGDHPELIESLTNAWLRAYTRMLRTSGSFRA